MSCDKINLISMHSIIEIRRPFQNLLMAFSKIAYKIIIIFNNFIVKMI